MSALTIDTRTLPVIDRAAIRLGTTLISWGRRRARVRQAHTASDAYRAEYAERVRTASAVAQQRLLP